MYLKKSLLSNAIFAFRPFRHLLCLVPALALAMVGNAQAQTSTWTGSTDGTWANGANWGGTAPVSGSALDFTSADGAGGTTLTDNLMTSGTYTVAGITFTTGAAAYTINPATAGTNGFTLTTGITNDSTSLETINDNIVLSGTNTFNTLVGDGGITIGGDLSGTGNLIVNSNDVAGTFATVTLANANYTGSTTMEDGNNLTINGGTVGSSSSTLTIGGDTAGTEPAVNEGGTLTINAGTTFTASTVDVGVNPNENNTDLTINGGTVNFTEVISGGGASGIGNNGNNSGTVTINGGTVTIGTYYAGRSIGGLSLVIDGGATTITNLLNVSSNSAATTHPSGLEIEAGSLTIGTSATTGGFAMGTINGDGTNTLTMTGGTLTYAGTDGLLLGSSTIVNMSGGTANLSGITVNSGTTNGSSALSVTGGTLYLGGTTSGVGLTVTNPSSSIYAHFGTATIGATTAWTTTAPIGLVGGDTTTFQAANASGTAENITLGGVISNVTTGVAGNLQVTGTGTLTLTGTNTYTGSTAVISGTLQLGNGTSGTIAGSSGVAVASGATLALDQANGTNYSTTISNNGTISGAEGSGITNTISTAITGGGVTQSGAGTTILTGANTYTGATTVSAGTLALGVGGSLSNTPITVSSGATFQIVPGTGSVTIGTSSAILALGAGSNLVLGGSTPATAETATFNTVTLNGTVTIGGATGTAGLTFNINGTSSSATDLLAVTGGVTYGTNGGVITIVVPTASAAPSGTTISYTLITSTGGLGTGSLTLASGSQDVFLGGNTYSTSLSASTTTAEILTLTEVAGINNYYWKGSTSSSWSTIGNFSTDHTGSTAQSTALSNISNVMETTDTPSGTHTASQTLDGSYTVSSLTFTSTAPAITLANGNSGSNALTIDASATYNVVTSAGTVNYGAGVGLAMESGGTAAQTISANIDLGASQAWQIDSTTHALTVSGVIADAAGTTLDALTKSGTGTLVLSGTANTYDGGTVVNAGTLALGASNSLPGALTVNSGTFDLAGNNQTLSSLSGTGGTITNSVSGTAHTLTLTNSTSNTFGGAITGGSLNLVMSGSGMMTLSGTDTYGGTTTVNSGILELGGASSLSGSSLVTVNSGAILAAGLGGTGQYSSNTSGAGSFGALLTASNITFLAGSALGLDATNAAGGGFTYAGNITNTTLPLTIIGTGTVTLSGTNSDTSLITVTNGMLVDGSANATDTAFGTGEILLNPSTGVTAVVNFASTAPSINSLASSGLGTSSVTLGNFNNGTPTTLTVGSSGAATTFAGVISDAGTSFGAIGSLTVNAGTLTLTGVNTYTGTTTVNTGATLVIANAAALQDSTLDVLPGGTVSFGSTVTAATLDLAGSSGSLVLTNSAGAAVALTLTGTASATDPISLSGLGSVVQGGSGTTILTGTNTFTGGTNITAGVLEVDGGSYGSSGSTIAVSYGGNGFEVVAGTATANFLNIGDNGGGATNADASITGSGSAVFGGVQIGSSGNTGGNLTIDTTGTVALGVYAMGRDGTVNGAGAVTTKGLIIQAGTVTATTIAGAASVVAARSSDINISGGSLTVGTSASTGAFELGTDVDSFLTMTGGTLTYLGTDGVVLGSDTTAGIIDALNISGSAASATATLTGITLDKGASSGANSTFTLGTGATVYLGSVGIVEDDPAPIANAISLNGGTLGAFASWTSAAPISLTATSTIQTANASGTAENITLSGVLSGGSALLETGTGTLTLSGANTYSGGTSIGGGSTLEFSKTTAMPSGGVVVLNNGGGATLAVGVGGTGQFTNGTSGSGTVGGLLAGTGGQGSPVIWSAGSTLGLDTTSATGGFSYGAIANTSAGALGLTKLGTGTATLTGANTYTGATTVSGGELIITSNLTSSSSITVASGATMELTGAADSTSGTITNNGTLILGAGVNLSSTGAFTNYGTLNLSADAGYTLPGNFVNHGTVIPASGGSSPTNPTDTPTMPPLALLILALLLFFAATPLLSEKKS